jgi:hypothetical protein
MKSRSECVKQEADPRHLTQKLRREKAVKNQPKNPLKSTIGYLHLLALKIKDWNEKKSKYGAVPEIFIATRY